MSDELLCKCGHRKYDHVTDDDMCWKCPCQKYVPNEPMCNLKTRGGA